MDYSALHETVLSDIYDIIKKGVADLRKTSSSIGKSSSLARATSGLTLVFPVLCTDTLPIDVATMVSKAIERKAVSMLQIALSAYNITNATDAVEHLKNFHTNLDIDSLTVDKFIDIMDSVAEGTKFTISSSDIRTINEDCRRNCNYYFKDDINPVSLSIYMDRGNNSYVSIIKEATKEDGEYATRNQVLADKNKINADKNDLEERKFQFEQKKEKYKEGQDKKAEKRFNQELNQQKIASAKHEGYIKEDSDDYRRGWKDGKDASDYNHQLQDDREEKAQKYREKRDSVQDKKDARDYAYKVRKDNRDQRNKDREYNYNKTQDTKNYGYRKHKDDRDYEYKKERDKISDDRDTRDFDYRTDKDTRDFEYKKDRDKTSDMFNRARIYQQASDGRNQQLQSVLVPSDVKKANEMQPTLVLVNYYVNDNYKGLNIAQQAVAGVKAKLYPIASSDIIHRLITKQSDADIILKLVKLSTREISVIKDFLLGAEEAKMDALNSSKKNSGYAIFNALERRAIKGKGFRAGRMNTSYKAISTLVITAEEAEEIKKNSSLDVSKASAIIPIMSKLNLLHFVIVDTTSEAVAILTDGDNKYEMYSFANLEREASDTNYKKVINLMTKVAR